MARPVETFLTIPRGVQLEAKRGNDMIKNGYSGGTPTGWRRGRQLASGGRISIFDVKVMRDWFARHRITSGPGYRKWIKEGAPIRLIASKKEEYRGAVAYLIWGGEEAYDWINTREVQVALQKADFDVTILP